MIKDIYIIGAGTYGEAMYELALIKGYTIKGFYDEDLSKHENRVFGIKVLGRFSDLNPEEIKKKNFIVAIGDNSIRYNLMNKINKHGGNTPTLIHPTAEIS